jgi:acetyl-CoA carboxylase carboxyl transferase subunit alpha
MHTYLDFESQVAELEGKIAELRALAAEDSAMSIDEEVRQLERKAAKALGDLYAGLDPWQKTLVARHPERPHFLDYAGALFEGFTALAGDRGFAEDPAILGGPAWFRGEAVMVLGHEKGHDTQTRLKHNFGMAKPEGYRKAVRLMRIADRFGLPLITFVDTPGAYPGIGAEERGQSEAIARNLYVMAELRTPIVGVIIGEGGSGGALALGVVDHLMMLQYSTYSVISPEGCASILWKSADKAAEAAETLAITANRLKTFGLVDRVVNEPLGGAHRDPEAMMQSLRKAIADSLRQFQGKSMDELLQERYERLMSYGKFKEAPAR